MKRLLLILLCLPTIGFAQYTELKLNPFGALWDKPDISFEIGISNKVALEFVLSARYGAAGTGSSISVGGQTISEPKKKGIGLMVVGIFLILLNSQDLVRRRIMECLQGIIVY